MSVTIQQGQGRTTGTYTPTLFNTTNVAASTARLTQYYRIGDMVTVFGQLSIDPTSAAATVLGVSLPIASAIATGYELNGTGASALNEAWRIIGDAANDRALMSCTVTSTANNVVSFQFSYQVI